MDDDSVALCVFPGAACDEKSIVVDSMPLKIEPHKAASFNRQGIQWRATTDYRKNRPEFTVPNCRKRRKATQNFAGQMSVSIYFPTNPLPRRSLPCASLPLASFEAPLSCLRSHPKHQGLRDRGALCSRLAIQSLGRASISIIFFCCDSFSALRTSLAK